MILDGLALPNKARFGALNLSQWRNPATDPGDGTPFVAGDLCWVTQSTESLTVTPSASVTPAGWTAAHTSITITNGSGNGVRVNSSYKILTASDINALVTGMVGGAWMQICACAFHFSRPIQTITQVSATTTRNLGLGPVSAGAVAWDTVQTGAHLYIGVASGDGNVSDTNFTWTTGPIGSPYVAVAPPDKGAVNATRLWYSFYPMGVDPSASETMQLTVDTGDENYVGGCLLRLN